MRIAVLTDVHGNLTALEAVLLESTRLGCDLVYHTGDAIGIGPWPGECVELLVSDPRCRAVLGNHELYQARGLPGLPDRPMSPAEIEHHHWVGSSLARQHLEWLTRLPRLAVHELGGTSVAFLHSVLRPDGCDFEDVPPGVLDDFFAAIPAPVVFFGHAHWPVYSRGVIEAVNPGSAGCTPEGVAPFALVTAELGLEIEIRTAAYDPALVVAELRHRKVPDRGIIAKTFFGGSGPM